MKQPFPCPTTAERDIPSPARRCVSLLLAVLCALLCAAPLFACTPKESPWSIREETPEQAFRSDEFSYRLLPERGEAVITGYIGKSQEVVVPAELGGCPVREIRDFGSNTVKRVVLPDGLLAIGAEAFHHTALEEIEIPDSVQRIGPDAFCSTPWLDAQTDEFVIVGDGVLIDWHPTDVLPYTPYDELIIPDNVKLIAFGYMREAPKAIRTLTIPGTVRAIGEKAFKNMYIEKLTIGDGVKEIGAGAFCSSLTGDHVTLPNSVTHIGDEAFAYNQELRAVFLGSRTESIGTGAFQYCLNLKKVTLPPTVTHIGSDAFKETLYWHGLLDEFVILGDGILIDYNGKDKDVVVPEGVKTVVDAFRGKSVERVTLPSGLRVIGESAFAYAPALQSVHFAASCEPTAVADGAFRSCEALREIELPDSVKHIGDEAFAYCSALADFRFPAALESMGTKTFFKCESLESAILPDGVYSPGVGVFSECTQLRTAKLPKSANFFTDYFSGCTKLEKIDIPNGVQAIGSDAFRACLALREVTLPETLEYIGRSAFKDCSALKRIVFPEHLREIQQTAFEGCTSLSEVILPADFRNIGLDAFAGTQLVYALHEENGAFAVFNHILIGYDGDTAEVVIPDGVERVAASFVYDLVNPPETPITSLIFPDSVTEIDRYALQKCSELRELTLGDGIRTIPADFLVNCRKLETVSLGRGLTYIAPQVFRTREVVLLVPEGSYAERWAIEHEFVYDIID